MDFLLSMVKKKIVGEQALYNVGHECPYWDHGCKEEMERRHTDTHEKEFLHIHFKLTMKKVEQKQIESTQRLQHNLDTANAELNAATKRIAILEEQNASLTKTLFTYTQLPKGRLEWKVEEVKQKIQNKEVTYSDPFYVGLYKCQGSIEWDYKNTGKVGVFIHIMRGDFDTKLHWPIRYKYTFFLINQINSEDNLVESGKISKKHLEENPEYFKRPSGYKNRGLGRTSLISNTAILEEKYYIQDSITLHISVELLPSL